MTRLRAGPLVAILPAALPLVAVLAILPTLSAGALAGPVRALGVVAVALYVAALAVPWSGALPWALGLLALEYLVSLELRSAPLDETAPVYAAALFLCAELGWLGLEARRGGRLWPGRAAAIGLLALGGAALGALLLLLSAAPFPGGAALTGLGVAATVAVAACLAWLGRR
ncbi:MAG TPA: hypothetical protein VOB72_17815 [Candidatus Dormibacteraeota bacterium]|nr:hypothetical protein [Candidatus Dormibacteraeota bacterium]